MPTKPEIKPDWGSCRVTVESLGVIAALSQHANRPDSDVFAHGYWVTFFTALMSDAMLTWFMAECPSNRPVAIINAWIPDGDSRLEPLPTSNAAFTRTVKALFDTIVRLNAQPDPTIPVFMTQMAFASLVENWHPELSISTTATSIALNGVPLRILPDAPGDLVWYQFPNGLRLSISEDGVLVIDEPQR